MSAVGFAFKIAHLLSIQRKPQFLASHWQKALVLHHVALSIRFVNCPQHTASGFLQGEESKERAREKPK